MSEGGANQAANFKTLLGRVLAGERLSEAESASAFDAMMSGDATPAQMGAFLAALRVRGETVEEITGAARTMRAKMLKVEPPEGAIDIVGTGGDGHGSFNVSTAAAIVVAGAGVPWPSTATAISRRCRARPTFCRRWASISTPSPAWCAAPCSRPASAS